MVLCVSKVETRDNPILELSDGWYSLRVKVDIAIKRFINSRKIFLGQKLHVQGSQLSGGNESCAILEAESRVELKVSLNSIRRAKWHETLGTQKNSFFPVSIGSIIQDAGTITCLDVIICRKYPIFYVEKDPNGISIFRTEQEENTEKSKWEVVDINAEII